MKKILLFVFSLFTFNVFSQDNVKIVSTESYELANIILALTQYGRTDPWDVQKIPPYYNEILEYFEPVKNHQLLKSVNYSRPEWEKFLGFRTDMYAFSFDQNGILKRQYPFNSFGPTEVDKNIDLINDFVVKSNYRKFYQAHSEFFKTLVDNYKAYYFLNTSKLFLDKIAPKPKTDVNKKYFIAISPLVGGQNCHRDTDSLTTVDFPNISKDLITGNLDKDLNTRISENHSIFTEMDHGYINPISDKYATLIDQNFKREKWNNQTGYPGISTFNEYMTWAVYDLFIKENFSQVADSIALQYQYLNANRGFIAQNIFSEKVSELYAKQKNKNIEKIYKPLLAWCKKEESQLSQPILVNVDTKKFVKTDLSNFKIEFSEAMQGSSPFKIHLYEFDKGNQTGKDYFVEVKNPIWSNDNKTLNLKLETEYKEFAMIFNWWGNDKPLASAKKIFLQPNSYILLKK